MTTIEWAENEVQIACDRENPNRNDGEFDYGCACYESALKAFRSLCEDDHSGMSIGFTKQILNRLIDGRPLTPIEDEPGMWNRCGSCGKEKQTWQHKRMSSLFKYVYSDGTVKYDDINRVLCCYISNPNVCYHSGLVSRIIDDIWPVTMPYYPNGSIKVYCEDFLTDRKNGDFDTVGIFYAVKPDGEKVEINRFFKSDEAYDGDWVEITEEQYTRRNEKKILLHF